MATEIATGCTFLEKIFMECGSHTAAFPRRSTRLREAASAWQASFAETKRKPCLREAAPA